MVEPGRIGRQPRRAFRCAADQGEAHIRAVEAPDRFERINHTFAHTDEAREQHLQSAAIAWRGSGMKALGIDGIGQKMNAAIRPPLRDQRVAHIGRRHDDVIGQERLARIALPPGQRIGPELNLGELRPQAALLLDHAYAVLDMADGLEEHAGYTALTAAFERMQRRAVEADIQIGRRAAYVARYGAVEALAAPVEGMLRYVLEAEAGCRHVGEFG